MYFKNGNINGDTACIYNKDNKFEISFTKVGYNYASNMKSKTFKSYDNAVKHLNKNDFRWIDVPELRDLPECKPSFNY